MEEKRLMETLQSYQQYLIQEEKSAATIEKYLRDVRAFFVFSQSQVQKSREEKSTNAEMSMTDREDVRENGITKEMILTYKHHLQEAGYAVRSINSMLASIHSLLRYMGRSDCRVKFLKQQKQTYSTEERQLTKAEYQRLLVAAQEDPQTQMILQTICGTGIRVSELRHFTVEGVMQGEIIVSCKGKTRTILIPGKLRKKLLDYARKQKIRHGVIFINRHGKAIHRSCIWARMKSLCRQAKVSAGKVFPHNLRKLFARTFYTIERDIAKLADILGHSSIDTTRIYIMSTGTEHRRQIERLGLVL